MDSLRDLQSLLELIQLVLQLLGGLALAQKTPLQIHAIQVVVLQLGCPLKFLLHLLDWVWIGDCTVRWAD